MPLLIFGPIHEWRALDKEVCVNKNYLLTVVIGGQRNEDRGRHGFIDSGVYTTVGDGFDFEDVAINVVRLRGKV